MGGGGSKAASTVVPTNEEEAAAPFGKRRWTTVPESGGDGVSLVQVEIPQGVEPGGVMQVMCPNGQPMTIQVPAGCVAGMKIQVQVPVEEGTPAGVGAGVKDETPQQQQQQEQPPSMTIRVQIPEGAAPGSVIQVAGPNGVPFQVQIPEGAAPGSVIEVPVPPPAANNNAVEPPQQEQQQSQQPSSPSQQPPATFSPTAGENLVQRLKEDGHKAVRPFFAANPGAMLSPDDVQRAVATISFNPDKPMVAREIAQGCGKFTCAHATAAMSAVNMDLAKTDALNSMAPWICDPAGDENVQLIKAQVGGMHQGDVERTLKNVGGSQLK